MDDETKNETLVSIFARAVQNPENIAPQDLKLYAGLIAEAKEDDKKALISYQLQVIADAPHMALNVINANVAFQTYAASRNMTDELTGLYSKGYFFDQLDKEIKRINRNVEGNRSSDHGSVIFIDLRAFKAINDKYGHSAGDEALKHVSKKLQDILHRPGDIVARMGGDEIAVLLPQTNSRDALFITNKIIAAFNYLEGSSFEYEGQKIPVHISAGVREIRPDLSVKDNYDRADNASMEVKAIQYKFMGVERRL